MKELKNILLEFLQIYITENNGWYNWCVNEINLIRDYKDCLLSDNITTE